MSTKSELLKLLESHRGEYLSGEELALRLGYSRTAVWKAMKSLREEGYRIAAVNNRGYALETDNDILSVEAVKIHLEHPDVFMQVEKEISSTNQYLKKRGIEENLPHGSFVAAEAQTEGKGRRGRSFYSPAGSGLYLSVLMRPKRTAQESLTLTAAAAVAVCRAVEQICGVFLGIKWVNDLYLGERKVCGILTEAVTDFETGDIELVIVGIGLNLRMPAGGFPKGLSGTAGAVLEDDEYVNRNLLTAGIINYLLEEAEKEGIPEEYISRNIVPGRHVRVAYGTQVRSVEAEKILPDGRLLIKNEQGEEEILPCGDVSLNLHEDRE
nr:biotin--[acetyl-CoA-carboxylase] ligase [uncultured Blautia sp.]